MNFLEKLIYAIKNKYIISIEYSKSDSQTLIQVNPIVIFRHNQKEYLLGEETRTGIIKNYKLSNIDRLEFTSFKFDKEYENPEEYINREFFRNKITIIQTEKDINSIKKYGRNNYSNIISYMIESLRSEGVNHVYFYDATNNVYELNKDNLVKLLKGQFNEMILPYDFKPIYNLWDKEIKITPDLSIYIGYPIIKLNSKLIPVLYFKCKYNIDNNTICDIEKGYINEKLCDEVIELTDDEITEFVNKDITIEDISSLIDGSINNYELLNKAYLFLHKDPLIIKSILNDIKDIEKCILRDITKPLKILFNCSKKELTDLPVENQLMLWQTNEIQESAIIKSQNNTISVIQGPPGTGKTQTILNIIINNFVSGKSTIIASTNNKAVDNVFEKLTELNVPKFYLRLGNKDILQVTNENFKDIIDELEKFKENNCADINTLLKKKKELIEQDKNYNAIYKDWLCKLEDYQFLLAKCKELQENLNIEYEKLINRGIDVPTEILSKSNNSRQLHKILSNLENSLIDIINKQNGKWTIIERISGLFINKEKRYIKKLTKTLKAILITDNLITNLDDLSWKIIKEIDRHRYAFTAVCLKEVDNKIENIDIQHIKTEIEKVKKKRQEYALELIKKQILINLSEADLNKLELNFTNLDSYKRLIKTFPVILCTNHSIPKCVAGDFKFDMGIIDEASQCDIPTTIPIIKRSHNLVVIGDDKQLNPITTIDERLDNYNIEKYKVNYIIKYRDNSIFDAYKKLSGAYTFLDRHYRCKKDIIEFSNKTFYNSQLKIMTEQGNGQNIKLLNVKGYAQYSKVGSKSGYNMLEVEAIIDYLDKLNKENFSGSIGIITPFRKQRELIENKIMQLINPFYQNIDVGTVHTFQGYEKDLIIFSTVISKNAKPGSIHWLNRMNKLLNVAITRAKNYFILVCDEEVLLKNSGNLRDLVIYIGKHGNKKKYKSMSIFETLKIANYSYKDIGNFKSLLNSYEKRLYEHIKELLEAYPNYDVYPKVRVADVLNIDEYKNIDPEKFQYGLKAHFDFVISRYCNGAWPICAIELDGRQHSFDAKTIYRDDLKNDICRDMAFEIVRIKTNFNVNIKEVIQSCIDSYKN